MPMTMVSRIFDVHGVLNASIAAGIIPLNCDTALVEASVLAMKYPLSWTREMPSLRVATTNATHMVTILRNNDVSIAAGIFPHLDCDTAPAQASPLLKAYLPLPRTMATMTKALASGMWT